jgi:hypothetical protein
MTKMINITSKLSIIFLRSSLIILITSLIPLPVWAQTYTSTLHGTSANRSAVEATFPYTTNGLCAHCHDQHASIGGTEPTLPSAQGPSYYSLFQDNYGSATNDLCYACHDTFTISGMTLEYGRYGIYQGSTKYDASIHSTSASMDWSPDASPPGPPFGPNSTLTDPGNCHNCHNPHGYDDGNGLVPHMLFARDSQTGDSPEYEMGCESCHDGSQGGATKDVRAQLNKTYAHPTHDYNDRHSLPESGSASFGPANRHAECVDCHNPHTVVSSTKHVAGTTGNAVSDVLKYVWGVQPSWTSIWTQPISFTVRKPPAYNDGAQYEYQICFKCHSRYGLGADNDGTANDGIYPSITPVTAGGIVTDQAMEFNPNNKSAHPIAVTLNNQTGSYAPKALEAVQLKAPWNVNPGNQTMYCSDCHGSDDETTSANGPHGSSRKYMLKGTGQYWPANSSGTLWDWNNMDNNLFCRNCHRLTGSNDTFDDHDRGAHEKPCVWCHVAVPHGSKRSRLIGYISDSSPYDYSNNLAVVGFKKAASWNDYDEDNCYSTHSDCSSKHPDEGPAVGGYDP